MIFQPVKVRRTGKFFFVKTHAGKHYPVGYCENCSGHDSEEGARQHYLKYLLDKASYTGIVLTYDVECELCEELTRNVVQVGTDISMWHYLCDKHRDSKGLVQVIGTVDRLELPDYSL